MDGVIYLHNLAGQALAQANARIVELEAEVARLREQEVPATD